MKNKFILLLLAVLAFGSSLLQLKAQEGEYIPFPTEGAVWYIKGDFGINNPSNFASFGAVGDTLINDTLYTKMYQTQGLGFGFLNSKYFAAYRENDQRQVWALFKGESEKRLIYDFSLKENEGIYIYDYYFFRSDRYVYVENIYTDTVLGTSRRVWNTNGGIWYEGVGGLTGGLFPLGGIDFTIGLSCLEQDGVLVFQSPFAISCDSIELWSHINENNTVYNSIKAYPTLIHTNDLLHIDIDKPFHSPYSLVIKDYTGKSVFEVEVTTQKTAISIPLSKGMYLGYLTNGEFVIKPIQLLIF